MNVGVFILDIPIKAKAVSSVGRGNAIKIPLIIVTEKRIIFDLKKWVILFNRGFLSAFLKSLINLSLIK